MTDWIMHIELPHLVCAAAGTFFAFVWLRARNGLCSEDWENDRDPWGNP
jgi:hypothetical protein